MLNDDIGGSVGIVKRNSGDTVGKEVDKVHVDEDPEWNPLIKPLKPPKSRMPGSTITIKLAPRGKEFGALSAFES